MLWLHIVIFVGLLSIFIPVMIFLIIGLKINNLFKSLLVTLASSIFTITSTFYVYSGLQLYIFISLILTISLIAGFWSYLFFEKHLKEQTENQVIS